MKRIFQILLLLFVSATSNAQLNLDSLWGVWNDSSQPDTNRLKAMKIISWNGYLFTKPDSAFYYAQMLYDLAKESGEKKYASDALNTQGVSFYFRSDNKKAIDYYSQSMVIREEIGDKEGVSSSLNNMGLIYKEWGDYEKAIDCYAKSLEISKEIGDKRGANVTINNIGVIYEQLGEYGKALEYALQSLEVAKEIGEKSDIALSLFNVGNAYKAQGNYVKAVDYHMQSLKIREEIGDKKRISESLNNLGIIYKVQKEYEQALNYYEESIKISEEIGDKGLIAFTEHNIGIIYQAKGELEKALIYYTASMKSMEEIGNRKGVAAVLGSLGLIYKVQSEYNKALDYYFKSLSIAEEIGDAERKVSVFINIGSVYYEQGKYADALAYLNESIDLAKDLGDPLKIKSAAQLLWEVNKKLGKHKKALEMFELYISTRDSITSEENQKAVIQQQFKYEYEKKAAADSIKAMEEAKVQEALLTAEKAETEKQKAQVKQQEQQKYYLYGGLALALLFGVFIFNRFRVTSKQKDIIEEQKSVVEQQKEEVESQKRIVEEAHQKLETTHLQLEESHKEITDSINYAERIQRSFLATKEVLDENLKDYFVFFKPKEAVSGDFYWAAELNDGNFAWSCADSTGHGVPGAIMSLLNISSLEKSIETETSPEKILGKTREIIINRLKKDGSVEGGKDGMDCNLLVINKERSQLTFASAHNPVIVVRPSTPPLEGDRGEDNSEVIAPQLIEFKGDKIPVGKHDRDTESFTLQTLQLQKGDVIYALTDGFPDQFGGPKGKKYMIKNLKKKLVEIASLPMVEQNKILEQEFEQWKQQNEQIDDVCIIGVRV